MFLPLNLFHPLPRFHNGHFPFDNDTIIHQICVCPVYKWLPLPSCTEGPFITTAGDWSVGFILSFKLTGNVPGIVYLSTFTLDDSGISQMNFAFMPNTATSCHRYGHPSQPQVRWGKINNALKLDRLKLFPGHYSWIEERQVSGVENR